jgi:hypothetical protein
MQPPNQSVIYTIEVDGVPTLAVALRQFREAIELCQEEWLRSDLSSLRSEGSPLYSETSKLKARLATEAERAVYRDMAREVPISEDILIAYLVEIDGLASGATE